MSDAAARRAADLAAAVEVSLTSPGVADALAALEAAERQQQQQEEQGEADAAVDSMTLDDASSLDQHAAELARWLAECHAADVSSSEATHDDVFFFFETTHPESLDRLPQLFQWISAFMETQLPSTPLFLDAQESGGPPIPRWVPDAVQRLEAGEDLAQVAAACALKSPVTLLYWKNEHAKRELQREHDSHRALDGLGASQTPGQASAGIDNTFVDVGRHRTAFMRESELQEWLSSRQHDVLTRQDVISHVMETYPAFAATKSPAALKVWTSRFLKRHLSTSTKTSPSKNLPRGSSTSDAAPEETSEPPALPSPVLDEGKQPDTALAIEQPAKAVESAEPATETSGKPRETRPTASRKRRGACSGGYVLHSNEFKLNALRKLDEGQSVSEVAHELGLKSQNSLTYWNSIRDKLVTAEKKRFRLAGGGRRSSCTFEGELLLWVSERHQKGLGTDVKAVLDYMREFHAGFTDGKKEPTLRKWILRFFKRCWRAPTAANDPQDPQDASKAFIFV